MGKIESIWTKKAEKAEEKKVVDLTFQVEDDKILWKRRFEDGTTEPEWHQEETDPGRPDLFQRRKKELYSELGIEEKAA